MRMLLTARTIINGCAVAHTTTPGGADMQDLYRAVCGCLSFESRRDHGG